MRSARTVAIAFAGSMALGFACLTLFPLGLGASDQTQEGQQSAPASPAAKFVGTVKAISGNVITLATDAGSTVDIIVQDSTRMVRISPGQKDLKDAAPIQLQ